MKVSTVEVKDVELPADMQRAMSRQAEAERERRAKIIAADGEFQASEKLSQAANIMSANPATLQLRYLQTLVEIGVNNSTSIVFPLPIDLLKPLLEPHAPSSVAPPENVPPLRSAPGRSRRRPTISRPRPTHPRRAEPLARDPDRPAHRPAGGPGSRARRAAGCVRAGPGGGPPRCRRALSLLRGPRGPNPARGLGSPSAGGEADTPGWLQRSVPNLYPVLGGDPTRVGTGAERPPETGFASSIDPLAAGPAAPRPTCFARSRPTAPTR